MWLKWKVAAWLWNGISILIILTGISVGIVRLLLPLAADYREQVAAHLGTALGAAVHLGGLEAKLVGIVPELRLTDLKIELPGNANPLLLQELRLRLNLISSLLHGVPILAWATISGARLVLYTTPGHALSLEFGTGSARTVLPLGLLLAQGPLLLTDGSLRLERPGVSPIDIQPVTATLIPGKDHTQLGIDAYLSNQGSLNFRADIDNLSGISGQAYLKTNNLELETVIAPWLPANLTITGIMDTELWADWNNNEVDITGPISFNNLSLVPSTTNHQMFKRLNADLVLHQEASGALWGKLLNLVWEQNGENLKNLELEIYWPTDRIKPQLRFAVETLQLRALLQHIAPLLPKDLNSYITKIKPQAEIQDFKLDLTLPPIGTPTWQVGGKIINLTTLPWDKIPGVHGLGLDVRANNNGGQARVTAPALELTAPPVFQNQLPDLSMDGDLEWTYTTDGVKITSKAITIKNQDFDTRTRLSIVINATRPSPVLDMQTQFLDGSVAAVSPYLPVGVMKQPLVDWLKHALVAGHIKAGMVLLRGPVTEFPFHHHEGCFQALLNLENVTLDYKEKWPRLEDAAGELRFIGPGLAIELKQGKMLDSQITEAHAAVADIKPASHLPITGHVIGPFADVLTILRGPLGPSHGRYVQGMQVQGNSEIAVKVAIPIESWASVNIDGQIQWNDNELRLNDWGLDLQAVNGDLRFTDQGLFAQEIQARLGGEPLELAVDTPKPQQNQDSATYLDVDLLLSPAFLSIIAPQWPPELLDGSAPGHLRLIISHQQDPQKQPALSYQLDSKLQGLAIKLPAPLGKSLNTIEQLQVTGVLPLSTAHTFTLRYGDIKAALRVGTGTVPTLISGEILSNNPSIPNPTTPGLNFKGNITQLDLPAWITWINHYQDLFGTGGPAIQAHLHMGELGLAYKALQDIDVNLTQAVNNWDVMFKSANMVGQLQIPTTPRLKPIQAKLTKLDIDLPTDKEAQPQLEPNITSTTNTLPDPKQAPTLDLQIQHLQIGSQPLGQLLITTKADPMGLQISQLKLTGQLLGITGTGSWTGTTDAQETQLNLEVKSTDFGQALRGLGFESALQQANLQAQTTLHWPAPPYSPKLEHLAGELQMHLGQGRVLNLDPGVGRLFGLLSLEAMQRRLSLDFSDLFGQGFAFDGINGNFTLQDGDAVAKDLTIDGPAATISATGRVGLIAKDYNQTITVTPSFSTTLPVAGAIAGGPVAAAALLVAGQVVGKQVNRLIRLQYQLTGSWDAPNMTRIETQDGWSFFNLLVPSTAPSNTNNFTH